MMCLVHGSLKRLRPEHGDALPWRAGVRVQSQLFLGHRQAEETMGIGIKQQQGRGRAFLRGE